MSGSRTNPAIMSGVDWDLLSSYFGLLTLATTTIYVGSFGSLKSPRKAKPPATKPKEDIEDDSEDEDEDIDRLTSEDAWMFPILGSVVLFGFYLVVKFLGKEWINWLLGWYFTFTGVGSIWRCSVALTKAIWGTERWKKSPRITIMALKGRREICSLSLRTSSLLLLLPSALPPALYSFWDTGSEVKSALLTDVIALSFGYNALSMLKLDRFKTGCILLSGLFVYDVWWVFGTEVMVKVATSLDVPIKLLWAKSMQFGTSRGFTMLGLGDIVVPGMFVSLALRYDYSRSGVTAGQGFAKPYFWSAISAYVIGLGTTMAVMHVWGKAQPALLYLSPACVLSFILMGLWRGELVDAWRWEDQQEAKQKKS